MKKRLLLIVCMLACLFMTTVSAKAADTAFDEEQLQEITQSLVDEWFSLDFAVLLEEYAEDLEQESYKALKEEYEKFAALQEKCGAYDSVSDFQYSYEKDEAGNDIAIVTVAVTCEKTNLLVKTIFDGEANLIDYAFDEYVEKEADVSKAEVMKTAGINTIMSMGIVFCVLILIAALIGCFIFINKLQNHTKQDAPMAAAPIAAAPVPAEEDLTDDLELVAVITAAIAAASGEENADGLVVRSIKKR